MAATATKKKSTSSEQNTDKLCDASKVKVGSVFSRHSFGKVLDKGTDRGTEYFKIQNLEGKTWTITADIVEAEFSFADQFETTETVSRTRAIEVLTENPYRSITISFRKKVDHKEVAKELAKGQEQLTKRQWTKKVKDLLAGEERTMEGYHTGTFDEHRRLRFNESGKGARLVDPRTVDWMIVGRTKYKVK